MTALDANPYEVGLDKNAANYVPLTPIGFLLRSAAVYPNRLAVAYGERRYSWRQALERCRRLALLQAQRGDRHGSLIASLDAAQHPSRVFDPSLRKPEFGERPRRERVRRLEDIP